MNTSTSIIVAVIAVAIYALLRLLGDTSTRAARKSEGGLSQQLVFTGTMIEIKALITKKCN